MVRTSVPARPVVPPRKYKTTRHIDLGTISTLPWALLDEHEAAAVLNLSVKVLRRLRQENKPPRYRKLNGFSVRYQLSDLRTYLEAQPSGGEGAVSLKRR
jgi:hypothetical protein